MSALKHCKAALEVDPSNGRVLWLSKLLERQRDVEMSKELATERLKEEYIDVSRSDLKMSNPLQVSACYSSGS